MAKKNAATFSVNVKRNRRVFAAFNAMPGVFLENVGLTAANRAKEPPPIGSPHDRGTNRAGIRHKLITRGTSPWIEIFTTSGYGAYLELGTKRMPARPYIVPAILYAISTAELERIASEMRANLGL